MRSNFIINLEDSISSTSIGLHCTLRQANKTFLSLSYALAGNERGYKRLSLQVETSKGERTTINVARFNNVVMGEN